MNCWNAHDTKWYAEYIPIVNQQSKNLFSNPFDCKEC
jgi:hypothetical protein